MPARKTHAKGNPSGCTSPKASHLGYALIDERTGTMLASRRYLAQLGKDWRELRARKEFAGAEMAVFSIVNGSGRNVLAGQVTVDWLPRPRPAARPRAKTVRKPASGRKKPGEANPEGFANKPRSVSVATAVWQVALLPRYGGITPAIGKMLYDLAKDVPEPKAYETEIPVDSAFMRSRLAKDGPAHSLWDDRLVLSDLGIDFVASVRGRLESLRNQKHNLALFDGLAGADRKARPLNGTPAATVPAPATQPARRNSLAARKNIPRGPQESLVIRDPDLAKLLGELEIKPKESVVITLAGGEGSGKTRALFRMMNILAQDYWCGHASMEEHPDSKLYTLKRDMYLDEKAQENIEAPEIRTAQDLHRLIQSNKVILIDSFEKLRELVPGAEIDQDLRKKYDGKIFIVIFQLTADGKMRGGSKSQFDGDVILHTRSFDDYTQNYLYPTKHRYSDTPLNELKYNVFYGKLLEKPENKTQGESGQEKVSFSFVATPANQKDHNP